MAALASPAGGGWMRLSRWLALPAGQAPAFCDNSNIFGRFCEAKLQAGNEGAMKA